MSNSFITTSESTTSDYELSTSPPASPSAPMLSWGIALLLLGIIIGSQFNRQKNPNSTIENIESLDLESLDRVRFTQSLQWVSYGKQLERQNQYEVAIAVYDKGLGHHPNDFRLWHERGLAFAKLQQFESALTSFDRAYRLRPNNPDLAHERGDTLLQLERYEDAIASYDIFLRYNPDNAHVLADRGYALCHMGQFEAALQSLNQVLKTERRDRSSLIRSHYYQIEALRHLGQLDVALRSSQTAIERYADEHFEAQCEAIRQQIAEVLTNVHTDDQTS
jgi:tetratricopeptide (TPR) repeat protein